MVKQAKTVCRACQTENSPDDGICQRCGLSLVASEQDGREGKIACPRCQSINNAGSFFCYTCGKYFADIEKAKTGRGLNKRRRSSAVRTAPKAKVIMPGGPEIVLTGAPVFIERSDFNKTLSNDILMRISRQHILITYDRDKYYLKDYGRDGKGSTNHTKLNGVDIYNKRKKALKDGDKIELADQPEITMTFRLLQEPK
ncbi:MAG: FHA domain-containing protein [Dehalococcoidia bacterium]|nr:FHA domain-containing protein [Dehalococcoidia bacterium]